MEARKITVMSTRDQKKTVLMSEAETLSELKADLQAKGVDYTDMTFYEGTSRTELKSDESVLPKDVPYKGTTTNELVFMLTTMNKKIKSGAEVSRAAVYGVIKANNLQQEVVKRFGKNFTQVKTEDLLNLINEFAADFMEEEEEPVETTEAVDSKLRKAFVALLDILEDEGSIRGYQEDRLLDILDDAETEEEVLQSSYSDEELNEMLLDSQED